MEMIDNLKEKIKADVIGNDCYLISGIKIDPSYNHTYKMFSTATAQANFFIGKSDKHYDVTYQRKNRNSIRIPANADEIRKYNYIMWKNHQATGTDKWYYAFILKIDWINKNMSEITYELDVLQTYYFEMSWAQSFIERCHQRRFRGTGTIGVTKFPLANYEDEGLPHGEYIYCDRITLHQVPNLSWCVVTSTVPFKNAATSKGTAVCVPLVLEYLVFPVYTGPDVFNVIPPQIEYFVNGEHLDNLPYLFMDLRASTRYANAIVDCRLMPYLPTTVSATMQWEDYQGSRKFCVRVSAPELTVGLVYNTAFLGCKACLVDCIMAYTQQLTMTRIDQEGNTVEESRDNLYCNFPEYDESKLYMYPYSFIELTDDKGANKVLKMEHIHQDDYTKRKYPRFEVRSMVNSDYYVCVVRDYALAEYLYDMSINTATKYYYELYLTSRADYSMPILNDYEAAYMQSHFNAIQASKANAQATLSVAESQNQLNRSTTMLNTSTTLMAELGTITAGVESQGASVLANSVNPMNLFSNAATLYGMDKTSGAQINAASAQAENANRSAISAYQISQAAAKLNYENSIRSTMAGVEDAAQIPPSVAQMGSNYLFNTVYDANRFYLLKKTVAPADRDRLQSYFKMYGYKLSRLADPTDHFNSRLNWNYIKMTMPVVSGQIPMEDLLKIKEIFMKGITLWHGDYIGEYDRDNLEA